MVRPSSVSQQLARKSGAHTTGGSGSTMAARFVFRQQSRHETGQIVAVGRKVDHQQEWLGVLHDATLLHFRLSFGCDQLSARLSLLSH